MKLTILFSILCLITTVRSNFNNERVLLPALAASALGLNTRSRYEVQYIKNILRSTNPSTTLKTMIKLFLRDLDNKAKACQRRQRAHKRQAPPTSANCPVPGVGYYNYVESLAESLRARPDAITTNVESDTQHAVTSYTVIEAPANANHREPIDLTVSMQATLTYDNTRPMRSPMPRVVTEHMQRLDWYHGPNRNMNDERGHLLADSLGGPMLLWNLVPQSPTVNRAVELTSSENIYCWYQLEAELREYLQQNPDHRIWWTIVIGYGGLPDTRRPTGFLISVRTVNAHNQFISYREFMIPNIPAPACNNPTHPYWHYT